MLEASAAPYVFLRKDILHLEQAGIKNAKSTRDAHHRMTSHVLRTDMATSYIAYAALVAADTPAFAAAIEDATKRKKNRQKFVAELSTNPAMVRDLPGADAAITAILETVARDATRIEQLGDHYIDQAKTTMQTQSWARRKLPTNGTARVSGAQKWGESRVWPAVEARPVLVSKAGAVRPNLVAEDLWRADWSEAVTDAALEPKANTFLTKALLLGARYAVGDLSDTDIATYGTSKKVNRCFKYVKLELNGCIAASRSPNEEALCIGKHGLHDISRCVGWPAGAGNQK